MEKKLYEIENELQEIYNELEENGGEVTDELLEKLQISNDNLQNKLDDYAHVISELEAKIDYCKNEEKRIKAIRVQREKSVEWLKQAVLNAVRKFGSVDKKGISRIETNTHKFSIRKSNSIKVDEDRTSKLATEFAVLICELNNSGSLYTGEDTDIKGILDIINAEHKADCEEKGEEFIPFDIKDLYTCPIEMSFSMSIANYFKNAGKILEGFGKVEYLSSIQPDVSKTELKDYFKNADNSYLSYANPVINESITIK